MSETGRKRLEEYRRNRERQRGASFRIYDAKVTAERTKEGITAQQERRDDAPRGLGEFERRANRDRFGRRGHRRDWDATPRSERGSREDAPSVRVPNVAWDSTPRRASDGPGWDSSRNRRWDAPTPRTSRGASPDEDDGAPISLDVREWEEEQIRLDRDWYTGAEEGNVAGDEDFNPLAQYEGLAPVKQKELATRTAVSTTSAVVMLSMMLTHVAEEDICEASAVQRR